MKITRRASRRATLATASIGALALLVGTAGTAQAATAVGLGTAESFAILAGTTVTNTGTTTVTGDLGIHPGSAVADDGSIAMLDGAIHAADAVALQAQTDLIAAYNNAAGQTPVVLDGVELGGRTLIPGVYATGGVLGLTGTLTLDGQGDPNAVFVLQSTATLITQTDSAVVLMGDAQACNVFWLVPSSATLGVRTAFVGTIMALTDIDLLTGATVEGRVLARNAAVDLDSNTITRPVCAAAPDDAGTDGESGSTGGTTGGATGGITGGTAGQVTAVPSGSVATGDGSTSPMPFDALLVAGVVTIGAGAAALVVNRRREAVA